MSYTTLTQSTLDDALLARIEAAVTQEAWASPDLSVTAYGVRVKQNFSAWRELIWPVAIANREAYAYAVESGNPNPGGDPGVITDADIGTAVQANWRPA